MYGRSSFYLKSVCSKRNWFRAKIRCRQRSLSQLVRSQCAAIRGRNFFQSSARLSSAQTSVSSLSPDKSPKVVHLKDYKPPKFLIEDVDLTFDLHDHETVVRNRMSVFLNPDYPNTTSGSGVPILELDGHESLHLDDVKVNGKSLPSEQFEVSNGKLMLSVDQNNSPSRTSVIEVTTKIKPHENTSLEGLYNSNGHTFVTQCEAQGFRKITYFIDRPDVMSKYTTTIHADYKKYPVLLSNGNEVDRGTNHDSGRHWVKWVDPHRKPSYLFALVAGNLFFEEDTFQTSEGRNVQLRIFVDPHNIEKCEFAMKSLKQSMKWDEDRFGLAYDLDVFNIVAVDDFTMGAMENKGLNVFNSKYVLATPETATDDDFHNIQSVVAHEYFHNWTGNRVTLRDWFQLSLKEGLTVFRDQEFSADLNDRGVERIDNVRKLKTSQFVEDASPISHPVRPESYLQINNFYTTTVYEKGAEVVRMIFNLVGKEGFRKGMDLYFERHDGQAVTVEDFVSAMEDANSVSLKQFMHWYTQPGTPVLKCSYTYNADENIFSLKIDQSCPSKGETVEHKPYHIPIKVALYGLEGKKFDINGGGADPQTETTLELKDLSQTFEFHNVDEKPVPSLLRDFTAPVNIQYDYTKNELECLLKYDTDPYSKWEAAQTVMTREIVTHYNDPGNEISCSRELIESLRRVLQDCTESPLLTSRLLSLPTHPQLMSVISQNSPTNTADPVLVFEAQKWLKEQIASHLQPKFLAAYESCRSMLQEMTLQKDYSSDPTSEGRALRCMINICLPYLLSPSLESDVLAKGMNYCAEQFNVRRNMTEQLGALSAFSNLDLPDNAVAAMYRKDTLEEFYEQWKHDPLIVQKWFRIQSTSTHSETLQNVMDLLSHRDYSSKTPNCVYAVIGAFSFANPKFFHSKDGFGYKFVADQILELDQINSQVAARICTAFQGVGSVDEKRQMLIGEVIDEILRQKLSNNVLEIASKISNSRSSQ